MELSRDNHYVPRLYLRKWGTNNKVYVYRLLVPVETYPSWRLCSIDSTASMSDLYTRIEDGIEIDDFESAFNSLIETPAKDAIDRICNHQRLSTDDWSKLCAFITAQYVRTPAFYLYLKQHEGRLFDEAINEVKKHLEALTELPQGEVELSADAKLMPLSISVADINPAEKTTTLRLETVIGKSLWLKAIKDSFDDNSDLRQVFRQLKWSIIESDERVVMPTTDNPISYTELEFRNNHSRISLVRSRAMVFPLSPTIVMIATKRRILPYRFKADFVTSQIIKQAIVNSAWLFIYSRFEDKDIQYMHPRCVDNNEFNRINSEIKHSFEQYRSIEAPLLNTEKRIVGIEKLHDLMNRQ